MRSPAPAMARWMVPRRLRLQLASWRAPRGKSSGVRDQDLFAPGLEAAGLACRSGRRAGGFGLFRGRAAPPRPGWGRGWPGPAGRGGRSSDRAPAHRSTSLSAELASVGERDATFPVPHGRGDQAKAEGLDPRETLGRKTGEINIPKLNIDGIKVKTRNFRWRAQARTPGQVQASHHRFLPARAGHPHPAQQGENHLFQPKPVPMPQGHDGRHWDIISAAPVGKPMNKLGVSTKGMWRGYILDPIIFSTVRFGRESTKCRRLPVSQYCLYSLFSALFHVSKSSVQLLYPLAFPVTFQVFPSTKMIVV